MRAALLDIDGTLLDSNDAHASAWVDTLAEFGVERRFEEVRPLIGMGGDKLVPMLAGLPAESERGRNIASRRSKVFLERYLARVQPFPGVRQLLERLSAHGLSLQIATSAGSREIGPLLEAARLSDLLEPPETGDAESKPDPDVVQAALSRAGVPAAEAALLGDTPYDLEACRRASVPMVAVRCGGWNDADLEGAVAIYDDPAELLARLDESPFLTSPGRTPRTRSGAAR